MCTKRAYGTHVSRYKSAIRPNTSDEARVRRNYQRPAGLIFRSFNGTIPPIARPIERNTHPHTHRIQKPFEAASDDSDWPIDKTAACDRLYRGKNRPFFAATTTTTCKKFLPRKRATQGYWIFVVAHLVDNDRQRFFSGSF